ncbi:hypothetical protein J5U23_01636 [Saccharolobus shibatae B12]|uniref:Uncharacterized protein n=1 Tax=Saccharolobus shibatae (strain ATCC 51178 / DSM 5389 / JCM 8931 / NBRC 15437 / B12) TaxID=523848 RepID=A0A8F5BNY1_SACSH|nr:hypothetical protein [Saccharolobus shibatae]QXJ28767.1 hypothetical protein J5U23_01636 [Saccharolobus shibatae B12]
MAFFVNSTPANITNISIFPGEPPRFAQPLPPPPWYAQYLPEFIIVAGIVATVLTFYFSPELRSIIKRLRGYP